MHAIVLFIKNALRVNIATLINKYDKNENKTAEKICAKFAPNLPRLFCRGQDKKIPQCLI